MQRFKTRQEFREESEAIRNWAAPEMNVYLGVPWEETGELNPHGLSKSFWSICDYHLTDAPHPYEGKDFIITFDEGTNTELLQKKCVALGYHWIDKPYKKLEQFSSYIRIEGKRMRQGDVQSMKRHSQTPKLTLEEFMRGDRLKSTNSAIQGAHASRMIMDEMQHLHSLDPTRPRPMSQIKVDMGDIMGDWGALTTMPKSDYSARPSAKSFMEELKEISSITNKSSKTNQDGRIIKVQRVTATITRGERPKGRSILGRASRTAIAVGYLSNKTITS